MNMSQKTAIWDGDNKQLVREKKVAEIKKFYLNGSIAKLARPPLYLTFAGAQAHVEKSLVAKGLAEPWQITTIQTHQIVGGHLGKPYLRKLIKRRDKALEGMFIWPHNFNHFCSFYSSDKKHKPNLSFGDSDIFAQEMETFLDPEFTCDPFAILDIDICGVFGAGISDDLSKLITTQKLDDAGLLFFTHQKGRDSCNGNLFSFVKQFIQDNQHPSFQRLLEEIEKPVSEKKSIRNEEQREAFRLIREHFAPCFLGLVAAKAGYLLTPEWLVEYRDLNPETNSGNYMYQWAFKFEKMDIGNWYRNLFVPMYMEAPAYEYKRLG